MPSARAACQEVRSTTAVEYIGAAVHRDCIVAAAGVDEPIVIADTDIQVVAGYADILVLQTADRAGVGLRKAGGYRSCRRIVGGKACTGDRVVVANIVGRRGVVDLVGRRGVVDLVGRRGVVDLVGRRGVVGLHFATPMVLLS